MLATVKFNVGNCKVGCWFNTLILTTVKSDVDNRKLYVDLKSDVDNGKVGC